MGSSVSSQLELIQDRFREGTLLEKDIQKAIDLASHRERRQSILYIQAGSTNPLSSVIGISIYEGDRNQDALDEAGKPLYSSIKEALEDGWRIIKFPEMALALDDQNNYGLGYEFILERWR